MKGMMILPQSLMPNSIDFQQKKDLSSNQSVSFGQFLKQFQGSKTELKGEKVVLGKEEQLLLQRSFEHLSRFKNSLLTKEEIRGELNSQNKQLKKLLEKMAQDPDFMAILPDYLKEMISIMLKQFQGDKVNFDAKVVDQLLKEWNVHQDLKNAKLIAEIDELLLGIQERLAFADGLFETQKVGDRSKVAQTTSKDAQILSKPLLEKISSFLNKTDGSDKKFELKEETFQLRDDLKKYLHRENQPISWRKEELVQKAQYIGLNQLEEEQAKQEFSLDLTSLSVEKMVKEEGKGQELKAVAMVETEEKALQVVDPRDSFLGTLFNVETERNPVKAFTESLVREQRMPIPEHSELFSQMVERFQLELKQGVSQMEIKLHPEELGRMQLKLIMQDGIITARIVTESVRVKELIEQNLGQFKETLAKDGLKWEEITVDVGQDELGQNPFAYQGQQQQFNQENRRGNSQGQFTLDESILEQLGEVAQVETEKPAPKDSNRLVDYRA